MTLTQRLLQLTLLGDIGVGAKPARHFAFGVEDRKCTREKPSVFTRLAPQWKGILPRFAGGKGLFDAFHYAPDLIGMVGLLPSPALHLLQSCAGVVVPPIVVPKNIAFVVRHPGQLRYRVCQSAKLSFALSCFLVGRSPEQIQLDGHSRDYIQHALILSARLTH